MHLSNQKGITLLLTLFILTAVLGAAVLIINLVLWQVRISRDVGDSEVAYYSAEAGTEKILYEINKNKKVDIHQLNNLAEYSGAEGNLSNGGLWKVIESKENFINPFNGLEVTTSQPLKVDLNSSESFQLSFNFNGFILPNQIEFKKTSDSPEDSGTIIYLKWLKTESPEDGESFIEKTPEMINLDSDYYYKFRLVNNDSGVVNYTITPIAGSLPMGVETLVSGIYRDLNRQINTDLPTWQIY